MFPVRIWEWGFIIKMANKKKPKKKKRCRQERFRTDRVMMGDDRMSFNNMNG